MKQDSETIDLTTLLAPYSPMQGAPQSADAPMVPLRPRHREIMRRVAEGQTNDQIALEMGLHKSSLSAIIHAPLFQAELEKLMWRKDESVVQRLETLAPEAVTVLEELLNSKSEIRRLRAAESILDRSGHGKIDKVLTGNLTPEDVIKMLNQPKEITINAHANGTSADGSADEPSADGAATEAGSNEGREGAGDEPSGGSPQ